MRRLASYDLQKLTSTFFMRRIMKTTVLHQNLFVEPLYKRKLYFSYILFDKYGSHESASYFFNKLNKSSFIYKDVTKGTRDFGFSLKDANSADAKEFFSAAADAGDPICQYELAKLSENLEERERLMRRASNLLIQADVELYKIYINTRQYGEAYCKLSQILREVEVEIYGIPQISRKFVAFNFEKAFDVILTDKGDRKLVNLPTLPDLVYEFAESLHVGDSRRDMYNIAASQGHPASIARLFNDADYIFASKMFPAVKKSFENMQIFVDWIKSSEVHALAFLYGEMHKKNDAFFIQLLKDERNDPKPLILFLMGQMYMEGDILEMNYDLGREMVSNNLPLIEKMATSGNSMALCCLGWFCEKISKNFSSSVRLYEKSALLGNVLSLFRLGYMNVHGASQGVRSLFNSKQGLLCYAKCAELNYWPAYKGLFDYALAVKDYQEASKWLDLSLSKGSSILSDAIANMYHNTKKTKAFIKFSKIKRDAALEVVHKLLENKESSVKSVEWARDFLDLNKNFYGAQQNSLQEGEEKVNQKSEEINSSSHHKQILSFTGIIYDNPQAVAEAQVSSLMNFVGKNISIPKTQMGPQNHGKEMEVFNDELRSSVYVKEPSPVDTSPLISLTPAAFLDEKLVAQAEYFAQTGISFATLQDAAGVGTVHMLGGLPPTEEESVLDSALDWMGLSHLSEDFSHLL